MPHFDHFPRPREIEPYMQCMLTQHVQYGAFRFLVYAVLSIYTIPFCSFASVAGGVIVQYMKVSLQTAEPRSSEKGCKEKLLHL